MDHLQLTILFRIKMSVALNVYEHATFDYNQAAHVNTQKWKITKQLKNLVL